MAGGRLVGLGVGDVGGVQIDDILFITVMVVMVAAAKGCEEHAQKSECQILHGSFLLVLGGGVCFWGSILEPSLN